MRKSGRDTKDAREEQPLWRHFAMAGLVAALLIPVLFFRPFHLIEARLYDAFSVVLPPLPPQPGAVVVAIDEPSLAAVGQRWPWPRDLHGRLIESLRGAGAKVIVFDVVFAEPSSQEADRKLAEALGRDVVLAAEDATIRLDHGVQTSRVNPLPAFIETGAGVGTASIAIDGDAYLRRMPQASDALAIETLRVTGEPHPVPPEGALIQYFGPSRTYPTVSYYQALEPDRYLPPDRLKGQIVFVGLSLQTAPTVDSGAPDAFPTPYTLVTDELTAGVEVHATILDNLRHELYVLPVSRPVMIGLIVGAALLAAGLSRRSTSWRMGVAALAAVVFFIVGAWALLRFGRLWAPPLLPTVAALAVFGTRFGLDYSRERRLRYAVSEAFSRYLSPDLVEQLARNPGALKLGGERRNLSILFCDVRGFTSLSEKLKDEPERLTALINRLLDPLSEAVLVEGGTIDKYMGDCVMAFWNAPLPSPEHPLRAVRAAMRMMEAVETLNEAIRQEEGKDAPSFAIGVGINTGDCVVGNVGSRWRYDYSVLGDTVNLASRLESLSKEYGVSLILGPDTAEAVRGRYILVELDRIAVRGRATQSAIYTALEPAALEPAAAAELTELHPRLLEAIRADRREEAQEMIERCRRLAPMLERYYAKLRQRTVQGA